MQWGFNAWQARPLFAGPKIGEAQVQLGSPTVGLVAPRISPSPFRPAWPAGATTMKIGYQGPLRADRQGAGYRPSGDHHRRHAAADVPLVAGEDVGKAGFFGRIWLG